MTNTFVSDNNYLPSITSEIYVPDNLVYDTRLVVTQAYTLTASQGALTRGLVVGAQSLGAATAVAAGGNTGNATCSAVTRQASTVVGAYLVTFTAATLFKVVDPNGFSLSTGSTGSAYTDKLGFTITAGGTAMVAGDTFTITVAAGTGNIIPSVMTAVDGSQNPIGIMVMSIPNSGSATSNCPVYVAGEFNHDALIFDQSWAGNSSGTFVGGQGQALAAGYTTGIAVLQPLLAAKNIYLKTPVSATGPGYATN